MKGFFVALMLSISITGFGQPTLMVDKSKIRIGDHVKATIRTDLSNGREWSNIKETWPDSLKGIEIISGPEVNTANPASFEATWTLAVFDTGVVIIPPLPLVISQNNIADTLFTNDVPLEVGIVEPDSSGLADLKEIYFEPFNAGYYKKYIPHVLIFLLIAGGLYFWLKQKKAGHVAPAPVVLPLIPHEWALQALDALAGKKLWQRGEVKEHYSELTGILREYLERRYAIHAKEQTSDEIMAQLRNIQLKPGLLADTEELISIADLIKFAKADPGMDIHTAAIARVRAFIEETIPSFQVEQEEGKQAEEDGVVA
jgi:hypothetical protein